MTVESGVNNKVNLVYRNCIRLIEISHDVIADKIKWSRYRPGVAQRVGRGIALLFHDHGTRRGWMASSTPRPHITPKKDPVPILHEAGWAPGPVWTGGKSRPHWNSIPDRPARSQSLYRLSYLAHNSGQYPVISLERLRKHKQSTANIASVSKQVWMDKLLHTSQKQCCFIQIFLSVFLETRVFIFGYFSKEILIGS